MSTLLVWKDQIEKIYARYSFYIVKILQFVLGLCVFGLINSNIGFMKALSSTVCTVGLAAVTAFLPVGMLALVAALLVLVHLYALSLPVAGLCLAIFLVMYIFYVRFTPKKSWLVVVAAVAVALKVPYVIPVVFGLLAAPSFAVSMMLGTIVYYMLHTVKLTASAFQSGGVKELLDGIMVFTKQILANKEMWMMVVVLLLAMMGSIWGENKRHQSCVEDSFRCGSNRGGSASGVRLYDIGCFLPGKFYFTGSCGDSSSRSDSRIFLPFCGLFKNRDITV